MWLNPRKTVDLVTFTGEIFNGKLYFLYREGVTYSQEPIRRIMTFKYEKLLLLKSPIKDGAKYCDHWKKKEKQFRHIIYTRVMIWNSYWFYRRTSDLMQCSSCEKYFIGWWWEGWLKGFFYFSVVVSFYKIKFFDEVSFPRSNRCDVTEKNAFFLFPWQPLLGK